MTNELIAIAKITQPGARGIAPRERLFNLLDKGRDKPVLWVSAPGGSGKTSLVASWLTSRKFPSIWYQIDSGDSDPATFFYYLGQAEARMNQRKLKLLPHFTPEYTQEVPTFSRRFFEAFYQRMMHTLSPTDAEPLPVLVLDNHHEVPPEALFQDILLHGLTTIPAGMTVIVISRGGPPSQLSRLRANNLMAMLGWSDLRFTLDESHKLLNLHGITETDDVAVRNLLERTDGWAAGLILLKEGVAQSSKGARLPEDHAPQEMFDYFANEIFQRTPPETQRFLLATSFFPSLSAIMAEQITGMREAGNILAGLSRNHYFTDWRPGNTPVYQYHPLFRDFLRARARDFFSSHELDEILHNTAALLLETKSWTESVDLLAELRDHNGIGRVIISSAQSLIEQGRNKTLLQWLSHLPLETFESDPWLFYWRGASLHGFDIRASEQSYNEAFHAFIKNGDKAGALLAWSGVCMNIITEWKDFSRLDQQITWLTTDIEQQLDALPDDLRARISGVILLCFSFRQPWHKNVVLYEERAETLIKNCSLKFESLLALGGFLLLHYTKTGLLTKARVLLDVIDPQTRNRGDFICQEMVLWRMLSASYYGLTAEKKDCLDGINLALDIADSSGMHVYDIYMLFYGALAGFIDFDRKVVEVFFERITALQGSPGLIYPIVYRQILGWKHIISGNHQIALEHVDTALQLTLSLGAPIEIAINAIVRAQLLFELGRHDEARLCLDGIAVGNANHGAYSRFMFECTSSWFYLNTVDESTGMEHLREAMRIGSQRRILMHHYWNPHIMATLCGKALEAGIETEYVLDLIAKHRLIPEAMHAKNEKWPWPFRINTLGCFEIIRHGQRLVFSGKKQEKPLSLFKALIVHGGRSVPAETLCDTLWPSSAGDSAHSSLKMTLSRLRRLLGDEQTIEMREGKLTINPELCWVDAWAFNDMAGKMDAKLRQDEQDMVGADKNRIGMMDDIIHIYSGEFLRGEKMEFWEINYRNRLQRTFSGLLKRYCTILEHSQCWDSALDYYRKALEADTIAEEFYQRLMVCHHHLGQKAEAVAVYNQCRTTLKSVLGISPSHQTEEILKNIITA